jgi:hypothetical protein
LSEAPPSAADIGLTRKDIHEARRNEAPAGELPPLVGGTGTDHRRPPERPRPSPLCAGAVSIAIGRAVRAQPSPTHHRAIETDSGKRKVSLALRRLKRDRPARRLGGSVEHFYFGADGRLWVGANTAQHAACQ